MNVLSVLGASVTIFICRRETVTWAASGMEKVHAQNTKKSSQYSRLKRYHRRKILIQRAMVEILVSVHVMTCTSVS